MLIFSPKASYSDPHFAPNSRSFGLPSQRLSFVLNRNLGDADAASASQYSASFGAFGFGGFTKAWQRVNKLSQNGDQIG